MSASRLITLVAALSVFIVSCGKDSSGPTPPTEVPPVPPPPPAPATLFVAANITACSAGDQDKATASLVKDTAASVLVVGDMTITANLADFTNCYNASWGQFKARTYPVFGNHEYGAAYDRTTLDSVFAYFGDRIPTAAKPKGSYSFDLGAWHVVVINDNWDKIGGTLAGPDSSQMNWLRADLQASTRKCVMAAFHQSRFLSGTVAGFTERASRRATWNALADAGVDVIINGHQHQYERMAPMNKDGAVDSTAGITQFNVGTGGESLYHESDIVAVHPNSRARIFQYGVMQMTLDTASYKWAFLPSDGTAAADTGSANCH